MKMKTANIAIKVGTKEPEEGQESMAPDIYISGEDESRKLRN